MVEEAIVLTGDDLVQYKKITATYNSNIVNINKEWLEEERESLLSENNQLRRKIDDLNRRNTPIAKVHDGCFIKRCPICNYVVDKNVPSQRFCDSCGQALIE